MSNSPKQRKKKRPKKRKSSTSPAVIVFILLLITGILIIMLRTHMFTFNQSEEAEKTTATAEPTLPPSQLSDEYFGFSGIFKTYESDTVTGEIGLDVSAMQEYVDWQAVSDSGIDFVLLRAGYRGYMDGVIHQDEAIEYNLQSASAAGLGIGLYFFSQAITPAEAIAEAQSILPLLSGYQINYPIYFDWESIEDADARTSTISTTELTACAKAFCETIEAAGYRGGVYFNLAQASNFYNMLNLKDYSFWLADYHDTPSFPYQIDCWQYSNEGTCDGIATTVDLNLYFKENNN